MKQITKHTARTLRRAERTAETAPTHRCGCGQTFASSYMLKKHKSLVHFN